MGAEPRPGSPQSVVLHSSWTGITLGLAGAALALALTVVVVLGDAAGWVKLATVLVCVMLVGTAGFDMPISAEFSADGVTRRTLLRSHHLRWEQTRRLDRLRVGVWRHRRSRHGGGLVAKVGRRSYPLVDRMEGAVEFDRIRSVLGSYADALGLTTAVRPPQNQTPTWMYRQRRWHPDADGSN